MILELNYSKGSLVLLCEVSLLFHKLLPNCSIAKIMSATAEHSQHYTHVHLLQIVFNSKKVLLCFSNEGNPSQLHNYEVCLHQFPLLRQKHSSKEDCSQQSHLQNKLLARQDLKAAIKPVFRNKRHLINYQQTILPSS